jgi:hypothetical protein
MTIEYSFDTSVLVDSWRSRYPPDLFPALWDRLAGLVDDGTAKASREVHTELAKKDDEVFKWANERVEMFVESDDRVQTAVRAILAQHPRLVDTRKSRSGADPFVIALAQVHRCTVVTYEARSNNLARPKIPDVCDSLGIPCIDVVDLIRQRRWRFS